MPSLPRAVVLFPDQVIGAQPWGCEKWGCMTKRDWVCQACNGRGGFDGPRGWIKCACVRPSQTAQAVQRRMNTIGGVEYKTLAEREHEQLQLLGGQDNGPCGSI